MANVKSRWEIDRFGSSVMTGGFHAPGGKAEPHKILSLQPEWQNWPNAVLLSRNYSKWSEKLQDLEEKYHFHLVRTEAVAIELIRTTTRLPHPVETPPSPHGLTTEDFESIRRYMESDARDKSKGGKLDERRKGKDTWFAWSRPDRPIRLFLDCEREGKARNSCSFREWVSACATIVVLALDLYTPQGEDEDRWADPVKSIREAYERIPQPIDKEILSDIRTVCIDQTVYPAAGEPGHKDKDSAHIHFRNIVFESTLGLVAFAESLKKLALLLADPAIHDELSQMPSMTGLVRAFEIFRNDGKQEERDRKNAALLHPVDPATQYTGCVDLNPINAESNKCIRGIFQAKAKYPGPDEQFPALPLDIQCDWEPIQYEDLDDDAIRFLTAISIPQSMIPPKEHCAYWFMNGDLKPKNTKGATSVLGKRKRGHGCDESHTPSGYNRKGFDEIRKENKIVEAACLMMEIHDAKKFEQIQKEWRITDVLESDERWVIRMRGVSGPGYCWYHRGTHKTSDGVSLNIAREGNYPGRIWFNCAMRDAARNPGKNSDALFGHIPL